MVEYLFCTQKVAGSSPVLGSINKRKEKNNMMPYEMVKRVERSSSLSKEYAVRLLVKIARVVAEWKYNMDSRAQEALVTKLSEAIEILRRS